MTTNLNEELKKNNSRKKQTKYFKSVILTVAPKLEITKKYFSMLGSLTSINFELIQPKFDCHDWKSFFETNK